MIMTKNVLGYILTALFVALIIWWNISVWDECLDTNTFLYCLKVMGR